MTTLIGEHIIDQGVESIILGTDRCIGIIEQGDGGQDRHTSIDGLKLFVAENDSFAFASAGRYFRCGCSLAQMHEELINPKENGLSEYRCIEDIAEHMESRYQNLPDKEKEIALTYLFATRFNGIPKLYRLALNKFFHTHFQFDVKRITEQVYFDFLGSGYTHAISDSLIPSKYIELKGADSKEELLKWIGVGSEFHSSTCNKIVHPINISSTSAINDVCIGLKNAQQDPFTKGYGMVQICSDGIKNPFGYQVIEKLEYKLIQRALNEIKAKRQTTVLR